MPVDEAPTITNNPATTAATIGTGYSFSYTDTGYPLPTFTLLSGSLPSGLSLSSTGVLSGTDTNTGDAGQTFTGVVEAANGVGTAATQNFSIVVDETPSITNSSPATSPPTIGNSYAFTYAASGFPAPTFSSVSGSFPSGLALDSTGVLSGTDTNTGDAGQTFTGVVEAANGIGTAATQNFSIVVDQAPAFSPASQPAASLATVGTSYAFSYTVTGTPAPTFSLQSGTLPTGLTLSSAGILSGTPTATGTFTGVAAAGNGIGSAATQSFSIVVDRAPAFSPASQPAASPATVGTSYVFSYTVTGTPAPSFSLQSGTLPTGLTLSSAGILSGTPTATGTFIGVAAAGNGIGSAATQSFSIVVDRAPAFSPANQPAASPATVGTSYVFSYTVTGTPAPSFSLQSGTLPTSLTLNSAGVLSGTPTATGTFTGVVAAGNGIGSAATQSFSIVVDRAPAFSPASQPAASPATVGTSYVFNYTVTGTPAPSFSLQSGTLPTSLTLSSAGVLSGLPTVTGTFTGVVAASNGIASAASQSFSIVVDQVPAFSPASQPAASPATAGTSYVFNYTVTGTPAPSFSLQSGTLPTGLTLSSAGVLSGLPTVTGTFTGVVAAGNGIASAVGQNFSIVVDQVPAFSPASQPAASPATAGTSYAFSYTVTGVPAPSFSVQSGTLPTGLTLSPTGTLSGTLTSGGTFTGVVAASNGIGSAAMQSFSIVVDQAPAFSPASQPAASPAAAGTSYAFSYTVIGTPAPSFSLQSGTLPTGLTLSSAGALSGTPTVTGTFTGVVAASNGIAGAASQSFSIVVGQAPAFSPASQPAASPTTVGTSYAFSYTVTGTPAPNFTVSAGALPAGLTLSSAGTITGTPTTTGTFTGTVDAHNGVGTDATQSFSIVVDGPASITSPASTTFYAVTSASFTVTTTGLPAPALSYSGMLPTGLAFNAATGVLSGTPLSLSASVYSLSFTAQNGVGPNATQSFTLTTVLPVARLTVSGMGSPETAGSVQSFTVSAHDALGNLVTGFTGTISFSSSDSHASLPAAYTFTSGDAGSHTFSAVLNSAGTQSVLALDLVDGLIGVDGGIVVTNSSASTLTVTGFPATTAGVAQSFTVTAEDAQGNVIPNYTGTVTLSSSDGQVRPFTYTFSAADHGSHVFSTALLTAGGQSLTVTDTADHLTGVESGILVSAAAAASLVVSGFTSATTAGVAHDFVVAARDAYGNVATGYGGTVSLTSSDTQAGFDATVYTFTTAGSLPDDGVHTFSGILVKAGTQSITVNDATDGLTASETGIVVSPAAAASFVLSGYTSSTVTGVAHTFTVTAQDAFGNTTTGYTGTIKLSSTDAAAAFANATGSVTVTTYTFTSGNGDDNGVHTFSATFNTPSLTQTFMVTDTAHAGIVGNDAVEVQGLAVTSFTQTDTGFTATFDTAFNVAYLHLTNAASETPALGAPSVTVVTGTSTIKGSLLVNSSTNSITFVRTSSILATGSYTVTFRSAATGGFVDLGGGTLAGDANGVVPGTNFVRTMTISTPVASPTLTIPSFARGPNGTAQVVAPNTASPSTTGIPITLTNAAANLTTATFTLSYNPAILNITGALNDGAGDTFTLVSNNTATGTASFRATGMTGSGTITLGQIVADAPNSAASIYKTQSLLDLSNIVLSGSGYTGAATAYNDDAVDVDAYFGDVSGDGLVTAGDAGLVSRVQTNTDTGFTAYQLLDPIIIGGVDGNPTVTTGDATLINQYASGQVVARIPSTPTGLSLVTTGADPSLSIPTDLSATAGGTMVVPVNIDDRAPGRAAPA